MPVGHPLLASSTLCLFLQHGHPYLGLLRPQEELAFKPGASAWGSHSPPHTSALTLPDILPSAWYLILEYGQGFPRYDGLACCR